MLTAVKDGLEKGLSWRSIVFPSPPQHQILHVTRSDRVALTDLKQTSEF